MSDLMTAIPEIFLLTMVCVVLLADLFVTDTNRTPTYVLTLLSLFATFVVVLLAAPDARTVVFHGAYVSDAMSTVLKAAVCLITFGVIVYSREYLVQRNMNRGEFFVLALTGVLGMMIMISANSLLSVYLGLELLSLSLYAMVAFDHESPLAGEAAMKYFVLGALASGMLLYGMSIIYGVTGTLTLHEISARVGDEGVRGVGLILGVVFIVVGLAFKLGAVPFHMWIPDVYDGAPTAVTTYIASAPKIAAFAMTMRILVEGLEGVHTDWQGMLIILAVLSLAVGNIVAIAQTSIKRMLAYSTISHIGFLLLGILSASAVGYSAAMFYSIVYALMSAGGFGMIILLSRKGFEADMLDDFKGLNDRSPWFAFIMLILMFSMAGVPPTVGFYAKLAVLKAVVDAEMAWLAVVAVLFSVIGAFYYLRAIKMMYFDKPVADEPVTKGFDLRVVLSTNGLLVLGLGIYPTGLMALCIAALGPVAG